MSLAEDRRTQGDAPASAPLTTPAPATASESEARAVRWVRWLVIGVGCGVVAGFLGGLWQPRTDRPSNQGEPSNGEPRAGEPAVDGGRGDRR